MAKDPLTEVFDPADHPDADVGDSVEVAQSAKARAAANMMIDGAPYDWIADRLGYRNAAMARSAVEKVIAGMHDSSDYGAARGAARARLSKLLRVSSQKAFASTVKTMVEKKGEMVEVEAPNEDQLRWFQAVLAVNDRLIRLDGLDAPTRVELRNPDAIEFDDVMRAIQAAHGTEIAEEGDPFEIVVEPEDQEDADASA